MMNKRKITKQYTFTVEGNTEKWYFDWLNECLKAQLRKRVSLPTALSSVVIIAFTIAILRGNDNKFSKLDAQILGMDLFIVMLVIIMQYCIYKCAFRKAKKMLNISKL